MTRVLAILEAGDRWPSGVVRGLVYKDLFARDGLEVEYASRQPLRVYDLTQRLPWMLQSRANALATLANEWQLVRRARDVDVVYLVKVLHVPFLRRLRQQTRARIVLDFGDAVWLDQADRRRDEAFRDALLLVDAVTTDNEMTASYVRGLGVSCEVIPDTPQLDAFDKRRQNKHRDPGTVVVGWIGTPSTLYNIELVAPALREVARRHSNMRLRLVGVGDDRTLLQPLDGVPYTVLRSYGQKEMIDEVLGMDIGLFPLQDIERSRVRGVLKATIYMAGEAAVIASPVGQVPDVVRDGLNGVIASTPAEWIDKLDHLVGDEPYRRALAEAGLQTVREEFSLEHSWQLLANVLCPRSSS